MNALDFRNYAALDGVNWSTLKELRRSPKHYRHRLAVPREDSPSLAMGRAVHTAVFEPDRFALDYAVFKGEVRRGKEWDAFKASHANDTILKLDEYQRCIAIRDAVRRHPLAAPYLERGSAEQTVQWTDPETGLPCKMRVDFLSASKPALLDLKTTRTIEYAPFASTACRLGYHCQMAFYRRGIKACTGSDLPVVIVAVETEAPHDVAVFEYGEDALYAGDHEIASLLTRLAYHRETDTWPGMYAEEQVLELPAWATPDESNDLTELELEAS